jgi:phage shock protein E
MTSEVKMRLLRRAGLPMLAIAVAVVAGCGKGEINSVPADALVVDVRTPSEYEDEHYPGAINIPVDDVEKRLAELGDQDGEIIVYCRSGRRSKQAKEKLKAAGYTRVSDGGGLRYMKSLPPKGQPAGPAAE